jgi:hypothetical protein
VSIVSHILIIALLYFRIFVNAGEDYPNSDGDKTDQRSSPCGFLTILSDTERVRVYLDTSYLGMTPLDSVCTPVGQHVLRCLPYDPVYWKYSPVIETLQCLAGHLIEKRIRFPRSVFIESEPFGATVRDGEKYIGETPLSAILNDSVNRFTISKNDFKETTFFVAADTFFNLLPVAGTNNPTVPLYLSQSSSKDVLPIYLTATASIVSGMSAAYFKIKADNFNNDYRNNGNTADLSRIHHNDTLAGISLIICQINLLGLAYLLFSR